MHHDELLQPSRLQAVHARAFVPDLGQDSAQRKPPLHQNSFPYTHCRTTTPGFALPPLGLAQVSPPHARTELRKLQRTAFPPDCDRAKALSPKRPIVVR